MHLRRPIQAPATLPGRSDFMATTPLLTTQPSDIKLHLRIIFGTSSAQISALREEKKNVTRGLTMTSPGEFWQEPQDTTLSLECADCAWKNLFLYCSTQKLLASTKKTKFIKDVNINTSNSWRTAKLPETQNLIPWILSLFCCYQCSITNHTYLSVMAEESMTKQYCPITQYILWTTALSFVSKQISMLIYL